MVVVMVVVVVVVVTMTIFKVDGSSNDDDDDDDDDDFISFLECYNRHLTNNLFVRFSLCKKFKKLNCSKRNSLTLENRCHYALLT